MLIIYQLINIVKSYLSIVKVAVYLAEALIEANVVRIVNNSSLEYSGDVIPDL